MDVNEATDLFENSIINLVNETKIPMVNIELVLSKVLSAVRDAKIRAINEHRQREAEQAEEIYSQELSEEEDEGSEED